MCTIGNGWKRHLERYADRRAHARKERGDAESRRIAEEVIAEIPSRVREAEKKNASAIHLYGWLRNVWLANGDIDRLYIELGSDKTVEAHHFKEGSAPRLIVEWCADNGLACMIEAVSIKFSRGDDEYNLIARPL